VGYFTDSMEIKLTNFYYDSFRCDSFSSALSVGLFFLRHSVDKYCACFNRTILVLTQFQLDY